MTESFDWNREDLWDRIDEDTSVRDYEPVLRSFLAYLLSAGWAPPTEETQ